MPPLWEGEEGVHVGFGGESIVDMLGGGRVGREGWREEGRARDGLWWREGGRERERSPGCSRAISRCSRSMGGEGAVRRREGCDEVLS